MRKITTFRDCQEQEESNNKQSEPPFQPATSEFIFEYEKTLCNDDVEKRKLLEYTTQGQDPTRVILDNDGKRDCGLKQPTTSQEVTFICDSMTKSKDFATLVVTTFSSCEGKPTSKDVEKD